MYIACPNCNRNFIVSADQIGETGRKVKCSKCTHIWFYTVKGNFAHQKKIIPDHPETSKIEHEVSAQDNAPHREFVIRGSGEGINLPIMIPNQKSKKNYIFSLILFTIILFLSNLLLQIDDNLRKHLGLNNLKIEDIGVKYCVDGLQVRYKLTNGSAVSKKLFFIKTDILDQNNRILASNIERNENIKISPKNHINIGTDFIKPIEGAKYVNITVGGNIDFLLNLGF